MDTRFTFLVLVLVLIFGLPTMRSMDNGVH